MKHLKYLTISFTTLCVLLSGCGKATVETTLESKEITTSETEAKITDAESILSENVSPAIQFTDDLGRDISIEQPNRVAILLGSYAQAWTLAGGTFCAAVNDAWDEYDLEISKDVINLGATKSLSLELLLSSEPDFVIASSNTSQHLQWKDTLEAANIPVAYFDVYNFDDYLNMLKIFTDITGRTDLYQKNGLDVQEQIQSIIEKSNLRENNPSVLVLRISASSVLVRGSEGNVLGEILTDLNCSNITDEDTSLLENLSIEHILQADPDYIFLLQYGDDLEAVKNHMQQFIADNPAWAQLSAVKNNQVYYMEKELFSLKPNHRWGEAYELVEEILENGP